MSSTTTPPNPTYPVSDIRDQDEAGFGLTPSQTVGPYVHIGLTLAGSEIIATETDGNLITVTLQLLDGNADPISDAMVEIWQARPDGTFNTTTAEGFRGLGRAMADDEGRVRFTTLRPGPVEGQAPHLNVGIFARGMLERLFTRLYFPEGLDPITDPVLAAVPAARRGLLVAEAVGPSEYHLKVNVQHPDPDSETPFFGL